MPEIFAQCREAISLASSLEPMAGAALAISLAYLNLERFRYRRKIRNKAGELLTRLEKSQNFSRLERLDQVRLLKDLSGLSDNDTPVSGAAKREKAEKQKSVKHFWKALYAILFSRHLDRYIVISGAAVSICAMYFGVADALNVHTYHNCYFQAGAAHKWLFALLLALVVPLIFVRGGNFIVNKLIESSEDAVDQLGDLMAEEAEQADIKRD